MYAIDLLMVIHPFAKFDRLMSKQKSYGQDTKTSQKSYKFDPEIKGQCRIGIIGQRSCMYEPHRQIVIHVHPRVKYG